MTPLVNMEELQRELEVAFKACASRPGAKQVLPFDSRTRDRLMCSTTVAVAHLAKRIEARLARLEQSIAEQKR